MDLTESIAPKSDQLNAEDLLTGPRTFTIDKVSAGSSEQPVNIHLVEFPGRPYRPSKTQRRIMVAAWGKETNVYPGRRLTLYRDPEVKFGGAKVGGIKISHLSHLDKRLTVALTETRGKRAQYTIEPLPDAPPPTITKDQGTQLHEGFNAVGITDKGQRLTYCTNLIGRDIASAADLTQAEAQKVIEALEQDARDAQPETDPWANEQGGES